MKKTTGIGIITALALASAGLAIAPMLGRSAKEVRAEGEVLVSDWSTLKEAVKNAANGATIRFEGDINAPSGSNDRLNIDGKTLTIDLNGHIFNRSRSSSASNGHAIEIQGNSNVTITNSSGEEAKIKGGYAENGGGVNIHEGSTATIEHVTLEDNKAGTDGGAIYNRGHLIMNDCVIIDCEAKDTGGGIYNTNTGYFELDGVTITQCTAKNDGGAMNLRLKQESTIRNSSFTHNESKKEDGGAISLDSDGKILLIYDTVISDNTCEDNGGGIDVEDGTLKLYGVTLARNSATNGGGVYFDGGSHDFITVFDYSKTSIFDQNYASKDGGALYNKNSTLTIEGGTFSQNVAGKSGGALRLYDGTTTISSGTFTANETQKDHGGAIYSGNDAVLNLHGGTFSSNVAQGCGGAINIDDATDEVNVQGAVTVQNNFASTGNDIYLDNNFTLTVTGSLEGSSIGVARKGGKGKIATGYTTYNVAAPSTYFFANDTALEAALDGDKVVFQAATPEEADAKLLRPFIPFGQQVKGDTRRITGANWMSGISGERYLNEINIPGTHDTSMRRIGLSAGVLSSAGLGDDYALTQKRYIREQYEEGVRYVDIRLHNRECIYHWYKKNTLEDDGKNLWQTHGKKDGGTYWAANEDGKLINLNMVLNWTKSFLERNPTECIIMGFTEETYRTNENPIIRERLGTILTKFIKDNPINTATGEPLIYLENNDLTADYTHMPQLKDVRGKILLETSKDWAEVGGFRSYSKAGVKTAGQSTDYHCWWHEKLADVNAFFADPEHQVALPKDGGAWAGGNKLFKIGLNCAPQGWKGIPQKTPIYHSDRLLPKLFFEEGNAFFDLTNKYVGWVKTDGATEKEWGKIWRSNYIVAPEDYVTITVDPNLGDPNYKTKTYTVLKNTPITIPYFNYDYDQATNHNYFQGWKVGEQSYFAGAALTVTENVTFQAMWADSEGDNNIGIDVRFLDCNNVDHLRPSEVTLLVNGEHNVVLNEAGSFHATYTGAISSLTPQVWAGIDGLDADTATKYRYVMSGNPAEGIVITFIHTNTSEVYSSISGSISWEDENDYDKLRPNTVDLTVELREKGDDTLLASHVFDGERAEKTWGYSLGSNLPKYRDGEAIVYEVSVKNDGGWAYIDNYSIAQIGFNLLAVHSLDKTSLFVSVRWADNNDEAGVRPTKVYAHIKANGVEVAVQEIAKDEETLAWGTEYLAKIYEERATYGDETERAYITYTVEITDESGNPISGYNTAVALPEDNVFDVLLTREGFDLAGIQNAIDKIEAIGTVAYSAECKAKIEAAREAVDALNEYDQSLVTNLGTLLTAEDKFAEDYAHLIEIDEKIANLVSSHASLPYGERVEAVNTLGRELLDLSSEDRDLLLNYSQYNALLLREGNVNNVYNLIEAIGDVELTAAHKQQIDDAKAAYAALSAEDKALVGNIDDLYLAEAEYFAALFLDQTNPVCAASGDDHSDGLNDIWGGLETAWGELSDEAKALLNAGVEEDILGDFLARYTVIVRHYGDAFTLEGGPDVQGAGYSANRVSASSAILAASVASLGLAALAAGIVLFNKRRHSR